MFCGGQRLLSTGPALSVVDRPSETSVEKTDFPLPRRYQLQIALWLGVGHCVYFFSVLGLCLVCRLYACHHRLCEFISGFVLLYLEDNVSLEVSTTFDSDNICTSSYIQISEPREEGFDEDIPFRSECENVSQSLHTFYL